MNLTDILGIITIVFAIVITIVSIFAGRYKKVVIAIQDLVVEALTAYLPDKKLSPDEVIRLQQALANLINAIKKLTGK